MCQFDFPEIPIITEGEFELLCILLQARYLNHSANSFDAEVSWIDI